MVCVFVLVMEHLHDYCDEYVLFFRIKSFLYDSLLNDFDEWLVMILLLNLYNLLKIHLLNDLLARHQYPYQRLVKIVIIQLMYQ